MKKLAFLLPFYKSVSPQTTVSLLNLIDRTSMVVMHRWGDAFIVHTRNRLANMFVESGIEWSFWVDDDMVLPFGDSDWFNRVTGFNFSGLLAGKNIIDRLMSHRQSIIGGLYFGRNAKQEPMYNEGVVSERERCFANGAPLDVIQPTAWVGTGAMLVHRQVYLDIQKKYPSLAPQHEKEGWHYFSRSETELTQACSLALSILDNEGIHSTKRVAKAKELLQLAQERAVRQNSLAEGEDVTFCRRAARAGHQPYVDLGAVCGHMGFQVFGPKELVVSLTAVP